MTRRKKPHYPELISILKAYCDSRTLDFHQYSAFHMRIMDGGYTVLDIWTTGRYYILTTDYLEMIGPGITERGNEKGDLLFFVDDKDLFRDWLDGVFFPDGLG